jgi:hypothetical protein
MQMSGEAQFWPTVGSHSVPRLVAEPQTEWAPEVVVTLLQTLNVSAALQASAPASWSQEM